MQQGPTFWQNLITAIWAPGTYAKVAFILATSPIWKPTAMSMWQEIKKVLFAEPGTVPQPAPHEDPFLNIPLAAYRAARRPPGSTGSSGTGPVSAGSRSRGRALRRRSGF